MKYSQICPHDTCLFCKSKLKRRGYRMFESEMEIAFYCNVCENDEGHDYVAFWYRPGSGESLFVFMKMLGCNIVVDFTANITNIEHNDSVVLSLNQAVSFDFSSLEIIQNKIKLLLVFQ